MNKKEKTKLNIIKECCNRRITAKDAAQRLKLTTRQVENLKKKYREGISLIHGNCGRCSHKSIAVELKQKITVEYEKLIDTNVNFTHFHEIINMKGIEISYTAMRNILIEAGFQSPKKRRKKKQLHKTRERREKFGELLQTDATPFEWFGNDKKFALHAFIDDATGKLTGLHISDNECMDGYLEIMRQTLVNHGTPEAIYADGLSIFFSKKKKEELTVEEELLGITYRKTQFGNICDELGIELIHARSSQAKGRVERLWQTLQSRLPVEFKLNNIKTVKEANEFLKETYIKIFNNKFAVDKQVKSCFVKLPKNINLNTLLCYKTTRKLDNGGCFTVKDTKFQILSDLCNRNVEILISKRLGVVALFEGKIYKVKPIESRKKSINSTDSMEMILSRFVFFFCLKNEHIA